MNPAYPRFFRVVVLLFLFFACQHEDSLELIPPEISNSLIVSPASLSELQNDSLLSSLLANSNIDLYKNNTPSSKPQHSYTISTTKISKATFRAYQAYTFPVENPNQPPFSFDNYVIRKHHNGQIEAFILRYHYDIQAWLSSGEKSFSHISRFDTNYTLIADSSPTEIASKEISSGLKSPCDVTVIIYHQTPQDGTYEWQPGAVCHHTTPGDECTIIIEYTINCHEGGGQAPGDSLMGEGDAQGSPPDPGMPHEGEVLPDNGGPPTPIPTIEPPLGPEEHAGDFHYLRQVIEEAVTPQTSEAEFLNKNNALAAYLLQLNPELFQDISMLFLSINHEQGLTPQDRGFLWEKAYELYNITKNQEHALPYHTTSEEFLNSLTTAEKESYTESITTTALLPAVKSVTGLQWPQSTQEWGALFQLLKPMLIEVGIEFLPLGGVYNAIDDMAMGLSEGDYTTAAIGLAGVLMEFIPWAKLLKAGKALFSIGKKAFTIFKIGYNYLQQLGDAIALGLKTTLEGNTVKLVKANGDEVARISNNSLHISKHGIKAAEGSVVFRSADEVNSLMLQKGYTDPPFRGIATEFVTSETEQFVRFHNSLNPDRPWMMKLSDIEDLDNIDEVRNAFSINIENVITDVSIIEVPSGKKIFVGEANNLYGYNGGGLQFFVDEVIDETWIINTQTIVEFFN